MAKDKNKLDIKLSRVILSFCFVVIVVLLLPRGSVNKYANLKEGFISPKDIYAPFAFEILKDENELLGDRATVANNTIPYFNREESYSQKTISRAQNFKKETKKLKEYHLKINQLEKLNSDSTQERNEEIKDQLISLKKEYQKENIAYKVNYGFYFDEYKKYLKNDTIINQAYKFVNNYKSLIYVNQNKNDIINNHLNQIIINNTDTLSFDKFITPNKFQSLAKQYANMYFDKTNNGFLAFWQTLCGTLLTPNTIFAATKTNNEINNRKRGVPLAKGVVKKGELLVAKNMVINQKIQQQLHSMIEKEKELSNYKSSDNTWNSNIIIAYAGKFVVIVIPLLFMIFLLRYHRRLEYRNYKKFSLILILIALQLLITFIQVRIYPETSEYLIFSPLVAMLVTIFYDARIAFATVIITSIYTSFMMTNNFFYIIIPMIPGVISIYSVNALKDRYQLLYKPFIYILLSQTMALIGFAMFLSYTNTDFFTYLVHILFNALLSPMLAFGFIVIIERLFKLPTDITLLELSDMTHPLLKKLQKDAPGTYHHSLVVGNLAEAAADSIGANSLLARVGAYYHDIGKTQKADYFIENLQNQKNKHDKISPSISAMILSNHVKLGYKMAKEYKLPSIITDFIRTHHGTTKMEYFYNKAKNEKKEEEKIDESVYRYPGPRPQTKETAILMIADVTEARCRSVDKPDYDTYKLIIDDIIRKKFQDGELDECDLKLNDLSKIRDAMLPVIMGAHHSRIKYPGNEKNNNDKK